MRPASSSRQFHRRVRPGSPCTTNSTYVASSTRAWRRNHWCTAGEAFGSNDIRPEFAEKLCHVLTASAIVGATCASSKPHPTLSCYYGAFDEAAETRGRAWLGDGSERSDVGFGSTWTLLWNAQPSAIKWRSCSAQGRDIRGSVRGIDCSGPSFPDIGRDGARRWSLFRPRLSCAGTDSEAAACASYQGFGAAGEVVDRESMPRFAT